MVTPNPRAPRWKRRGIEYCLKSGDAELARLASLVVPGKPWYGTQAAAMFRAISQHAFGHPPLAAPGPDRATRLLLTPHLTAAQKGARIRRDLVRWARWAIDQEPAIHYTQTPLRMGWVRAWRQSKRRLPLPAFEDCSSSVTGLYCVVGAPDPNGQAYSGFGYTGTMIDHCEQLPGPRAAMPGDLVIWSDPGGPSHHVCMVIGDAGTDNPALYSHGWEGGPIEISFEAEHASQASRGHSAVAWLTVPEMPDRRRP